jgi:hypothetical protein
MIVMTTDRSGVLVENETHVQLPLYMSFFAFLPPKNLKERFE